MNSIWLNFKLFISTIFDSREETLHLLLNLDAFPLYSFTKQSRRLMEGHMPFEQKSQKVIVGI